MNLFLILTAMLSALAGIGRPAERMSAAVEASQVLAVAQSVAPAIAPRATARPDGYIVLAPLILDLGMMLAVARPITPERRRE